MTTKLNRDSRKKMRGYPLKIKKLLPENLFSTHYLISVF